MPGASICTGGGVDIGSVSSSPPPQAPIVARAIRPASLVRNMRTSFKVVPHLSAEVRGVLSE